MHFYFLESSKVIYFWQHCILHMMCVCVCVNHKFVSKFVFYHVCLVYKDSRKFMCVLLDIFIVSGDVHFLYIYMWAFYRCN